MRLSFRRLILVGLANLLIVSAQPRLRAEDSLATILLRARTAIGLERLPHRGDTTRLEGVSQRFGMEGKYSLVFDLHGRFVERVEGLICKADGFDGKTGWTLDWTGMP